MIGAGLSLPGLRQELRIEPGAALVNGAPSWTLFDPVRHMFFQLGQIEFNIFSHWATGAMDRLAPKLKAAGLEPDEIDAAVGNVIQFSLANHLTTAPLGDAVSTFSNARTMLRKQWWKWLLDNYLFFRIPLVRPARFLEHGLPRVAFLWSAASFWFFTALALLGFFLVSRQWDSFLTSFNYFFSTKGVVAYALGLSVVKIAHEFGHAFTATRYGCRVPTMGVSFLVMFPVLYTDTTGAWRLKSRRKRLAIDCAGVAAELMIASISTLAWVFLPDGAMRSVVFVLATSSWIMSLGINLNPFMKFDGYYVLSDLLDVPNLQPRAFALGRWKLRELLFDLRDQPPEHMPARLQAGLIIYAWLTWVYRLILFTGIALLVYYMFFKMLGVLLFAVEIGVFVIRPVVVELKAWQDRRQSILSGRRGKIVIASLLGAFMLVCLPLDRHVDAPAVLASLGVAPIVSGDPAVITAIRVVDGQNVKAGTVLVELSAPELAADGRQRLARIAELEARLARAPSDATDLADRSVLQSELATEREAMAGLARRQDRLFLRAPIDGTVTDLARDIHPGRWVGGAETLLRIVTPGLYDIQAYVGEGDIWRIEDKAIATFVPNNLSGIARKARLEERAATAAERLDQPILASLNGGDIAVNQDANKQLKPREALYRMRFVVERERNPAPAFMQPVAGRIQIKAQATSWAGSLLRLLAQIWRQEASAT